MCIASLPGVEQARRCQWHSQSCHAAAEATTFVPWLPSQYLLAVSYAVHNLSGAAGICREDLMRMLSACLHENDVAVPSKDVEALVERTFASFDADGDGFISPEEYRLMVEADKSVLAPLTMNVPELIAAAKADAVAAAAAAAAGSPAAASGRLSGSGRG